MKMYTFTEQELTHFANNIKDNLSRELKLSVNSQEYNSKILDSWIINIVEKNIFGKAIDWIKPDSDSTVNVIITKVDLR